MMMALRCVFSPFCALATFSLGIVHILRKPIFRHLCKNEYFCRCRYQSNVAIFLTYLPQLFLSVSALSDLHNTWYNYLHINSTEKNFKLSLYVLHEKTQSRGLASQWYFVMVEITRDKMDGSLATILQKNYWNNKRQKTLKSNQRGVCIL